LSANLLSKASDSFVEKTCRNLFFIRESHCFRVLEYPRPMFSFQFRVPFHSVVYLLVTTEHIYRRGSGGVLVLVNMLCNVPIPEIVVVFASNGVAVTCFVHSIPVLWTEEVVVTSLF